MFKDDIDQGYMTDPMWWFNDPVHQFRIADLDKDYPAEYFPLAEPPKEAIEAIVKYVKEYFFQFRSRTLLPTEFNKGIIDFGAGGGWTMNAFEEVGIGAWGYEGTSAGLKYCEQKYPECFDWLYQIDLRTTIPPQPPKWDVAICTEVAEHIHWPFHAILIKNLISHSDFIWWSSEGPEVPNSPHLHHVAEAPIRYWQNLFAFYGYGCYLLPDEVFNATEGRGRCIFYNRSVYSNL